MFEVIVIVHLLAASVWLGGSVALIVAAVPSIRTLELEHRVIAMKRIGLRWRPLGYGSLIVLGVTGVELARHDWEQGRSPFQTVLWVKVALSLGIVLASYLHNFVLGPRVQAEVREQRPQKTRPILVVVGYVSLALTITVPILGAILAKLAG